MNCEKIILRPTGGVHYTIEYLDDTTDIDNNDTSKHSIELLNKIITKEPHNIGARLKLAELFSREGKIEQACQIRFEGCNMLLDAIPDDQEDVLLNWDADQYNRDAIEIFYLSGIDHFAHGDYEYSAALLEMALMLDEEDHMMATIPLLYCYIALEEWELFDENIANIDDKSLDYLLLNTLSGFIHKKIKNPKAEIAKKSPELIKELVADEHPVTKEFLDDIESPKPSTKAQAREIYLQTEGFWQIFPEFIAALK